MVAWSHHCPSWRTSDPLVLLILKSYLLRRSLTGVVNLLRKFPVGGLLRISQFDPIRISILRVVALKLIQFRRRKIIEFVNLKSSILAIDNRPNIDLSISTVPNSVRSWIVLLFLLQLQLLLLMMMIVMDRVKIFITRRQHSLPKMFIAPAGVQITYPIRIVVARLLLLLLRGKWDHILIWMIATIWKMIIFSIRLYHVPRRSLCYVGLLFYGGIFVGCS